LKEYRAPGDNLKHNPQAIIDAAQGEAIALLNRNKPTAYIIPAKTYEMLIEMVEDIDLAESSSSARVKKPT